MIKTRPRRLYYFQPADSYYYIIGGKKKKLKTDKKISQKQLAKINITNIIGVPQAKRVQKRKKRRTVKMQKDISSDILKPATQMGVSFYVPKKEIPELGKLQSTGTKNEDLAKIVGELIKGEFAKVPKPISQETKGVQTEQPEKKGKFYSREAIFGKLRQIERETGKYPKNPEQFLTAVRGTKGVNETTFREALDDFITYLQEQERKGEKRGREEEDENTTPLKKLIVEKKGGGLGYDSDDDGLFNDELSKLLYYKTNKVVPVIASDELHSLLKYVEPKQKYFTAVINTNPSASDGSGKDGYPSGHWRCFFIDNRDDYLSAEFYDPLADAPEPSVIKIMKKICEIMNPEKMFLYKQNMVKHQSDSSSNCGHFVLKFIDDRANGVSWSKATGFDDVIDKSKDGEKMIEKYKSYL